MYRPWYAAPGRGGVPLRAGLTQLLAHGAHTCIQSMHKCCTTLKTYLTKKVVPGTIVELDARSALDARHTRDVVTYLYGAVQHMQNTYDNGPRVSNVALHPKLMKLQNKKKRTIPFLALKDP